MVSFLKRGITIVYLQANGKDPPDREQINKDRMGDNCWRGPGEQMERLVGGEEVVLTGSCRRVGRNGGNMWIPSCLLPLWVKQKQSQGWEEGRRG